MLDRIKRGLRVRLLGLLQESTEAELEPMDSDEIAAIKNHFKMPKFFVLGYPRSGTTLLARLLGQSPEISCRWQGHFASGENDWLDRIQQPAIEEWLMAGSNRWVDDSGPSLTALARVSADFVMERIAIKEGSSWVGDKTPTPRMDLAIERLYQLYPDAFVIAIVRDGRDAALSQRIQAFVDQPETLSPFDARLRRAIEKKPEEFGVNGRSIFSPGWLERVAAHWAASVGRGHQLANHFYGTRFHAIRYEDLLQQPIGQMKKVFDFLQVDFNQALNASILEAMKRNPAADWHRQAAPELARHLRRGASGTWQDWFTEQNLQLFLETAADQLTAWRYPTPK